MSHAGSQTHCSAYTPPMVSPSKSFFTWDKSPKSALTTFNRFSSSINLGGSTISVVMILKLGNSSRRSDVSCCPTKPKSGQCAQAFR